MNLKDLNNITIEDLKNIDWRQSRERLQSRPGLIIGILMVTVTLFVVYFSYKKYMNVNDSLKKEITELQEKSKAKKKFETVQGQFNDFVKDIPKVISGDRLIDTLSEIAINRNVQILSFSPDKYSPAKEKSNAYIRLTNVTIDIKSENYDNIILFVRDIETFPYSIRIGGWSGTLMKGDSSSYQRSWRSTKDIADENIKDRDIKATIEIESVEFKNV